MANDGFPLWALGIPFAPLREPAFHLFRREQNNLDLLDHTIK